MLQPLEEGLPGLVGEERPSRASVGEELPVAALVVELPASVASCFVHKSVYATTAGSPCLSEFYGLHSTYGR